MDARGHKVTISIEIDTAQLAGYSDELYHHQERHYWWKQLTQLAKYQPGGTAGAPDWDHGAWVAKPTEPTAAEADPT